MDNDLVWYVSYGSNMLEERFRCYILGGLLKFNGIFYDGCADKTWPLKNIPVEIPYDMYFSKKSRSWDDGAVCFLDAEHPGFAYGRAWLVTKKQFEDIHKQEGKGWYDRVLELPPINGIPALTITSGFLLTKKLLSSVGESYLNVLRLGLSETFPDMSDVEIEEYLKQCGQGE